MPAHVRARVFDWSSAEDQFQRRIAAIQKAGVKAARQADAASRMVRVLSVLQQQQTPMVTANCRPKTDPKSREDASAQPRNTLSVLRSITTFRESSVRELQEADHKPASYSHARSCCEKVVANAQGLLLVLQRTFSDTLGHLSRSCGDDNSDGGGGGADNGDNDAGGNRTTAATFTAQVVTECFHHIQMALALLGSSHPTTTLRLDQSLLSVATTVRQQIMQTSTSLSAAHTRLNAYMPDDESESSSLSARDEAMQAAWLCVKHACGCLETVIKSVSLDVMRDAVQCTHLKAGHAASHGLSSSTHTAPPPAAIYKPDPQTKPQPHSEAQTQRNLSAEGHRDLKSNLSSKSTLTTAQACSSDTSTALSFLVSVGEVLFAMLLRSQHTGVLQMTRDAFDATLRRICFVKKRHAKGGPQLTGKCMRCHF